MARILIIDDEESIVFVLKEFLKEYGYEVDGVYDGESALKRFYQEFLPDLVIIDLNVPKISGKDVIMNMRSNDKMKDIPVIIITGSVFYPYDFPPEGTYQALIEKPFDLFDIKAKIEDILTDN